MKSTSASPELDRESAFRQGFLEAAQDTSWPAFASSWDRLEVDTYMADGGTYRRRRYSEFDYDAVTGAMTLRPHVPYSQPRDINHLNGGIERHYSPIEEGTHRSPAFTAALALISRAFLDTDGRRDWLVQCFQNRITATADEAGQPAPEGPHRDGVDYVLTLLVDRNNITGGASEVYTTDLQLQASTELSRPGEFIALDDHRVVHGVTPLVPLAEGGTGHRDVLIAMFTAREGARR